VFEAVRENNSDFKPDYPSSAILSRMRQYSLKTTARLQFLVDHKGTKHQKNYMTNRKSLVDWLSGVADSLHITNQAIHHAVVVLDLYASRETKEIDIWLSALCALLVSAKFV
jgi:hypothetical protein